MPKPPPLQNKSGPPPNSDLLNKFLASMTMTHDKWHDGEGYDLATLRKLPTVHKKSAEQTLLARNPKDWRDIEALAQLNFPAAKAAVKAALTSDDPSIRRVAQRYVPAAVGDSARTRAIVKSLKTAAAYKGLPQVLMEVQEFHPPKVIDALFLGALKREGETAVHFAAMLYYPHGKAKESFDWDHRPFFLRFNTENKTEREAVFRELCQNVGVHPARFL
jgi:hypothetical protein